MLFKILCVPVFWTKVALALEGLKGVIRMCTIYANILRIKEEFTKHLKG